MREAKERDAESSVVSSFSINFGRSEKHGRGHCRSCSSTEKNIFLDSDDRPRLGVFITRLNPLVCILLDVGFEIRDLEHIYDINHYIINRNISGSSSRLYSVDNSLIKMGKETRTLKRKPRELSLQLECQLELWSSQKFEIISSS
ncbi:hypothetical protein NC653_000742 [Populus alba x Populus x berolinensis]|uniref:Uncharacterized protein n=2 Tax=Populus TaxID=3689 RepID=A0A4U5NNL6_POPAL|nr:hypothetical protein NC653_000742 [Populus alba x Populus x berolinensis]TKR84544.1 hypothetical protein D5086_0000255620 [Populus alba]